MLVKLLAFGILRDHLGSSMGPLELPPGSTVRDLLDRCRALVPEKAAPWSSIAVAVNEEYVPATHALADGDEVALLPPVSGGADDGPCVRLVHERIVARDIIPRLERPEDGGVVIFDGVVRNNSRERKTRYLEYEAYEAMALKQMQLLAGQAFADFPIRNLAIVHRLGRLEIGESSVLIAVFSAHRAAAFDACRWLIDTLKQTVPIWKKEFFEDGAVWAQGDPFPLELTPERAKVRKPAAGGRPTKKRAASAAKKVKAGRRERGR
jgi:molybdopterin synthase catalytic subunit